MKSIPVFSIRLFAVICQLLVCLALSAGCGGGGGGGDSVDGDFTLDGCRAVGLKVANGRMCTVGDNPSESSLVRLDITGIFGGRATCTGVALNQFTVLTAGHCFMDGYLSVQVATFAGSIPATFVVMHPGFSAINTNVLINDVAVVHTAQPMNLNVSPVLLSRPPALGEEAIVAGFGEVSPGGLADVIHAGNALVTAVSAQHVTIEYQGNQAHPCAGDSGGPLLVQQGGAMAVVGIVSQSDPSVPLDNICLPGDVTLYTSTQDSSIVSFINDWVSDLIVL